MLHFSVAINVHPRETGGGTGGLQPDVGPQVEKMISGKRTDEVFGGIISGAHPPARHHEGVAESGRKKYVLFSFPHMLGLRLS